MRGSRARADYQNKPKVPLMWFGRTVLVSREWWIFVRLRNSAKVINSRCWRGIKFESLCARLQVYRFCDFSFQFHVFYLSPDASSNFARTKRDALLCLKTSYIQRELGLIRKSWKQKRGHLYSPSSVLESLGQKIFVHWNVSYITGLSSLAAVEKLIRLYWRNNFLSTSAGIMLFVGNVGNIRV